MRLSNKLPHLIYYIDHCRCLCELGIGKDCVNYGCVFWNSRTIEDTLGLIYKEIRENENYR